MSPPPSANRSRRRRGNLVPCQHVLVGSSNYTTTTMWHHHCDDSTQRWHSRCSTGIRLRRRRGRCATSPLVLSRNGNKRCRHQHHYNKRKPDNKRHNTNNGAPTRQGATTRWPTMKFVMVYFSFPSIFFCANDHLQIDYTYRRRRPTTMTIYTTR